MKYLTIFLIILGVNLICTEGCIANIWDYAVEGLHEFPNHNGEICEVSGKLLNLDVELKGFYKNGEEFECTTSTRLFKCKPITFYDKLKCDLDISFFKCIFGEIVPTYITLQESSDNFLYYTDQNNDFPIFNSTDIIEYWPNTSYKCVWNETLYNFASLRFENGELTDCFINSFLDFEIINNQIVLRQIRNKSYDSIIFQYIHHPVGDFYTTVLDENYFCITSLIMGLNEAATNNIENDVEIQFTNGEIFTSHTCRIDVFSINGTKVASTIGESLDITKMDKGIYIIKAENKTLKINHK